jgi:hypothetical protein
MAIGFLSMLTPLDDRIERWATSGNATRILLHPEDYLRIENKKDKYEAKYNLPVECLGGANGIRDYMIRQKSPEEIEEVKSKSSALESVVDDV